MRLDQYGDTDESINTPVGINKLSNPPPNTDTKYRYKIRTVMIKRERSRFCQAKREVLGMGMNYP